MMTIITFECSYSGEAYAGKVDTIDDVSKEASAYVAKSFKRYAKK